MLHLIRSKTTGERGLALIDAGGLVVALQWLDGKSADAYESGEASLADSHVTDAMLDEPEEWLDDYRVLRTLDGVSLASACWIGRHEHKPIGLFHHSELLLTEDVAFPEFLASPADRIPAFPDGLIFSVTLTKAGCVRVWRDYEPYAERFYTWRPGDPAGWHLLPSLSTTEHLRGCIIEGAWLEDIVRKLTFQATVPQFDESMNFVRFGSRSESGFGSGPWTPIEHLAPAQAPAERFDSMLDRISAMEKAMLGGLARMNDGLDAQRVKLLRQRLVVAGLAFGGDYLALDEIERAVESLLEIAVAADVSDPFENIASVVRRLIHRATHLKTKDFDEDFARFEDTWPAGQAHPAGQPPFPQRWPLPDSMPDGFELVPGWCIVRLRRKSDNTESDYFYNVGRQLWEVQLGPPSPTVEVKVGESFAASIEAVLPIDFKPAFEEDEDDDPFDAITLPDPPEAEQIKTPCPHCGREFEGQWFTPCPSDDCPSNEVEVAVDFTQTVTEKGHWRGKVPRLALMEKDQQAIIDRATESMRGIDWSFDWANEDVAIVDVRLPSE